MSTSEPPYRFEDAQGYSVIVIQPRLNDSQWSEFENVGNALLGHINQAKTPSFLVDLSGLNYMGSAMVALIVRMWKAVKECNGRMVVVNRHPMVYEVMKLAGLHNVWTIVETRDQGLKLLGKKGESSGDGTGPLMALGALGVVAGLVGLALLLEWIPSGLSKQIAMACTLGGAAIGLFAGAICAAKGKGTAQKAGIFFAAASAAIMIVGIIKMPGAQTPAPQAPATQSSSSAAVETAPVEGGSVAPVGMLNSKKSKRQKDDAPKGEAAAAVPAETAEPAAEASADGSAEATAPAEGTAEAEKKEEDASAAKEQGGIKLPPGKPLFKKGDNK